MQEINGNEFIKEFIDKVHERYAKLGQITLNNCTKNPQKANIAMTQANELAWVQHELLELMEKYSISEG